MGRISAAVGAGRPNRHGDVLTVQSLLNHNIRLITPYRPIAENGAFNDDLRAMILEFQRRVVGLRNPDGIIGVNGPTWRILSGHANGPAPTGKPRQVSEGGLTNAEFTQAARELDCEPAAIRAVAETETKRAAFDALGRPTILFERHWFHALTGGKHDEKNPDISSKVAGGYGKYSEQYGKFERASALDAKAAMKSCSWGMFQIMGFNHKAAGFDTVEEFVSAMRRSVAEHLKAFVNFIKSDPTLLKALRAKDWTKFAARYNGSGYKKNAYDAKMKTNYNRILKESGGAPPPEA